MSDKNLDDAGRWRSKTVAFRVSPEEADLYRPYRPPRRGSRMGLERNWV